jgi:hydroxymethylbilane synthase
MRAATRGSALARWQTSFVLGLLGGGDEVIVETTGDLRRDVPIHQIGGRGVFVKEVQAAVLDGRADIAVHSAKDLTSGETEGLVLAAFPARANPFDCLVGSTLGDLPPGARVATGSVRRRAQLAALRPDLLFAELRGNIETRLRKAADFDAAVMAAAALERLGLHGHMAEVLGLDVMVPQVSQGALAVECRADDSVARERLAAIDDAPTRRAVEAERAFLSELGGGCDLPVGAYAQVRGDDVTVTGLLAARDGGIVLRATRSGRDGVAEGRALARQLLDDAGGADLLWSA